MNLVIIEAPAKIGALKKYLGNDYDVFATKGHIRDLPAKSFALDMHNNFEPKYEIMPDKKQLISELKTKAAHADKVYIATDPDREGEAIAWHIATILGIPEHEKCRIQYNEISEKAVKNALLHPREIDESLVNAQQARRVLDRIVGYKLSPIICKKIQPRISAGRVQSVALKLVVDREKEIEAFVPDEYWPVSAFLTKNKEKFKANLEKKHGKKFLPKNEQEAKEVVSCVQGSEFNVDKIKKSVTKSHAPAPFTTSTMQQDALNKAGLSVKRTTASAQQLYEGVEIAGEGKLALITYIRTDSTRVSVDAQNACREFARKMYGDKFVPEKPNIYAAKASAQDAHEAIRPINMNVTPEKVKSSLSPDNYKLYKLIYERFLASQMSEAIYSNVTASLSSNGYEFKAVGKTQEFAGYTAAYKEYEGDEKQEISRLPILEKNEKLNADEIKTEQKFTKPPARYTEATLVKAMEEKGIGRPATYAATIMVITSREYVSKDGKYLVPTELGRKVTEYLEKFFSSVINVKFTAYMENRLDDIASNNDDWHVVVNNFWDGFSKLLSKSDASGFSLRAEPVETDIVCDKCGHKMLLREGKFGKFLGCSNFPKCKNIMPYEEHKKVVGKCPDCGGDMVERKSKKGKTFFSCSNYPTCKFMSWNPTTGARCPKCNAPLIIKYKKVVCSECDYKEQ